MSTHKQIKLNKQYLEINQNAEAEFLHILETYTSQDKEIIDHILQIRPEKELDYITFLAEIENLGPALNLNINVKSNATEQSMRQSEIPYEINFFGSFDNLKRFLAALEELDYYIDLTKFNYTNIDTLLEEEEIDPKDRSSNISVNIKLITK